MVKRSLCRFLRCLRWALLVWIIVPILIGLWYGLCGERWVEQQWLDQAIAHCKLMRQQCDDPDLREVLDYTTARYNRVGGFDVAIVPCYSHSAQYKVVGVNIPWCPGLTLDPELMAWDIREGAVVLVHEALHDYPPYVGHGHIDEREQKLRQLSWEIGR